MLSYFSKIIPFVISFIALSVSVNQHCTAQQCETMVWSDEFDGSALNMNNWTYEIGNGQGGWGTGQLDYATNRNENVRIEDGKLVLELRKENYAGYQYTSGRLVSYQKQAFLYGRIEARIKGVDTQGLGFAFWMLGEDYETVWWPKCGEIDIMENTGGDPSFNIGTAHFQESWGHHYNQGSYTLPTGKFADDFHTFALEWTPEYLKWYIDDINYHTFDISEPINGYRPFNRPFFIILSVGVGGSYSGNPDAKTTFPMSATIDYVRVYQGAFSAFIEGENEVVEGDVNKTYSIDTPGATSYNWTVPVGSSITSGQGTNQIVVNWAGTSGDVQVVTNGSCGEKTYSLSVEVESQHTSDNLALNKPAYASSQENASYAPAYCVDGDESTRWASNWNQPEWVYVDLQKSYNINQVILKWQYAHASAYEIQVSDNAVNWNTIYTETSGDGETDDISLSGTGRYLRILCNQRNTQWGFSLFELEVYGSSTTAVNDIQPEDINLFPNPAKTSVTLEDNKHLLSEISIFNNAGQKLRTEKIKSSTQIINLEGYSQGIYFIRCKPKGSGKSLVKPLVITE
ncbi:family 16 glycosylhydrolase [Carboxylicivirga caseinilyticus]|uniref:family 16 glycosylhydrolase n=1 Tax=Carboxylicivirga caseinilyticus TaxID=3417572 RepID=UPI003D338AD1|nr:family 16 glycosylhydrolase [Marinilabiliaceae bacterium A049]